MPIMNVYLKDKELASEKFEHNFFVVKNDYELFWGEENKLTTHKLTGSVLIWMRSISVWPEVSFVLSDWQLLLDGVDVSQIYQEGPIDIEGKTVDLRHNNYRFVCDIPKIQYEPGSRIDQLRAMY
ncbi:MAG: hypothetical protein AAF485_23995 [Chloroflexota bacterium]